MSNSENINLGEMSQQDIDDIIKQKTEEWNVEFEKRQQADFEKDISNINKKYDEELYQEYKQMDLEKQSDIEEKVVNESTDDVKNANPEDVIDDANQKSQTYEDSKTKPKSDVNHTDFKDKSTIKNPKVVDEIDDALVDAVNKAENVTGFTNKFAKGAAGFILAAGALHIGMNVMEDKKAESMMKKNNKQVRKQREEEYEEQVRQRNESQGMYYNVNQNLFASRTGHTNTWGGRRY